MSHSRGNSNNQLIFINETPNQPKAKAKPVVKRKFINLTKQSSNKYKPAKKKTRTESSTSTTWKDLGIEHTPASTPSLGQPAQPRLPNLISYYHLDQYDAEIDRFVKKGLEARAREEKQKKIAAAAYSEMLILRQQGDFNRATYRK